MSAVAVPRIAAPARSSRKRRGRFSPTQGALYAVLAIIAVVYISPFLIQVVTSVKTEPDAATNPMSMIPNPVSFAALNKLLLNSDFPHWFLISAVVSVCVMLGRVLFDSAAGYALARLHFRGRNLVFGALIGIMAVPGVALLIPRFLVLRQVGLYDTLPGIILPFFADAAGVFIMKNFFEGIPVAVEESARVDGANIFRTYWSVVLPMARPALVTILIMSFQGSWNELQQFIVSAQRPELINLTKGVALLISGQLGQGTQYPLKLAAATLMTIPVAIIFFIFQKRIMNNATGAVKE
ncbi:MAG: carbohydrate ABC transporter permease [Actinomycetia bacterium]|nr:carbohydrate ABC transporter permease [Actinomycetes bacterium]